jgi:hypothetical protein
MSKLVLRGGLCLLLGLSLVFQPVAADVLQSTDACTEARRDAETETSGILWFAAGCVLGLLGVLGAYLIKPNPPSSKMLGKSPEYVAQYTDCYKDSAGSIQTKWAWIGCGTGAVLYLIYVLVIAAATVEAVSTTP